MPDKFYRENKTKNSCLSVYLVHQKNGAQNFYWVSFSLGTTTLLEKRKNTGQVHEIILQSHPRLLKKLAWYYTLSFLTLLRRRPLSYRNKSIDWLCKSMDWFLYDNDFRHERVKQQFYKLCQAAKKLSKR